MASKQAGSLNKSATVSVKADLGGVNQLKSASSTVTSAYKSMSSSISSAMSSASKSAKDAASSIKSTIAGIKGKTVKINVAKGTSILPHYSMSGDFNPKTKAVPKVSVSWWAKGGIFTQPTIFANGVGEAGPEAVLPLSRLQSMLDASGQKYAIGDVFNITLDYTAGSDAEQMARDIARNVKQMRLMGAF